MFNSEIIGILASVIIIISFLFNDGLKIRIINSIGGVIFLIYGILIGSVSTIFLQAALIIIQITKIFKEIAKKKSQKDIK